MFILDAMVTDNWQRENVRRKPQRNALLGDVIY